MIDGQRPDDEHQSELPKDVQPGDDRLDAWADSETTMIPVVPPDSEDPFDPSREPVTLFGASGAAAADYPPATGPTRAQRRLEQQRPPRDMARTVARGIGQTLITAGLVVLLFVVYEVYVTDIFGHEKQQSATAALDKKWNGGGSGSGAAPGSSAAAGTDGTVGAGNTKVVVVNDPGKLATDPATRKRNYQAVDGQGFAKIFVPKFGPDYIVTIVEGTTTDDLYVGPGHYENTQFPGEPGNFSVAGHRVSKGSPFNELGLLSSCDAVVIETQSDWFVYRVMPMQNEAATWATTKHAHCAGVSAQNGAYAQTYGREITDPSDYAQVLPVPHVQSRTVPANAERLITLTTCHPQFSDAQRMIIHGVLVKSYKKAAAFLPPELNES